MNYYRGISKLKCCISELNIMGMVFIIMFLFFISAKTRKKKNRFSLMTIQ
jgi:hypothetical protein